MFRPEAVPAGRRGAMLACVLFLAVVALDSLSAVRALPLQSAPSSEDAAAYPDGDRDTPAAADEDAGRYPYADGAYGDGTYGPEQRAQELYLDGMDKLGGGHREWAQETFESVIARFPNSAAAGLARQRLGDLYRGTPPTSATTAVSNPVQPSSAHASWRYRRRLPRRGAARSGSSNTLVVAPDSSSC